MSLFSELDLIFFFFFFLCFREKTASFQSLSWKEVWILSMQNSQGSEDCMKTIQTFQDSFYLPSKLHSEILLNVYLLFPQ
jgi:hypothetical protein